MPRLDQRIGRLERARPAASDEGGRMFDPTGLSTGTLREFVRARKNDGSLDLEQLSDSALAEIEAAFIAQRSFSDEA